MLIHGITSEFLNGVLLNPHEVRIHPRQSPHNPKKNEKHQEEL